ncbi:hypothetical protein [Prochlorothrix hollandica]|uniref:Uncharacterized protein n=1 Tax=Prochlorothrix hollandica PCC 9006 = CALU 1027 TaxID=317619 RepID=A0A0M2PXK2_PROHO|nr:hypothetical protein [Prochlorothrix hollandica]KKI99116.1 hypothetical protein PROH_15175 [Prochlorothrix hollandica PCC 9006 = CALU 1027]
MIEIQKFNIRSISLEDHLDITVKSSQRPAIILTDFRDVPFLICLELYLYYQSLSAKPVILVSQGSLNQGDYGDAVPFDERTKRLQYLQHKFDTHCLTPKDKSLDLNTLPSDILTGIYSSAISITRNEKIQPSDNPELFQSLQHLACGAITVGEEIKNGYDAVFIFNGRLASSLPK